MTGHQGHDRVGAQPIVSRIVSGAQTGVDRASLDFAVEFGVDYSGWVPLWGWAEDETTPPGVLARYPGLRDCGAADPAVRTRLNVRDSDATLLLGCGTVAPPSQGAELTRRFAASLGRPLFAIELLDRTRSDELRRCLCLDRGNVALNIAGPRESEVPGIYDAARRFLRESAGLLLGERGMSRH